MYYLLHTSSKPTSEQVCGSVSFLYDDGSRHLQYLIMEKHLTYWWFSNLKTDAAGVACTVQPGRRRCRLSWCAIDNPHPEKTIRSLCFQPPDDDGIYALVGLTLADRAHYVAPNPVSLAS